MICRIMKRFSFFFFPILIFFNHLSVFVACFSTNKVLSLIIIVVIINFFFY